MKTKHHCHLEGLKGTKEEEEAKSIECYDEHTIDEYHTPCGPFDAQIDQV